VVYNTFQGEPDGGDRETGRVVEKRQGEPGIDRNRKGEVITIHLGGQYFERKKSKF
jgi:hypothetical protein